MVTIFVVPLAALSESTHAYVVSQESQARERQRQSDRENQTETDKHCVDRTDIEREREQKQGAKPDRCGRLCINLLFVMWG